MADGKLKPRTSIEYQDWWNFWSQSKSRWQMKLRMNGARDQIQADKVPIVRETYEYQIV